MSVFENGPFALVSCTTSAVAAGSEQQSDLHGDAEKSQARGDDDYRHDYHRDGYAQYAPAVALQRRQSERAADQESDHHQGDARKQIENLRRDLRQHRHPGRTDGKPECEQQRHPWQRRMAPQQIGHQAEQHEATQGDQSYGDLAHRDVPM